MSTRIASRRAWLGISLTLALLILGVPAAGAAAAGGTAVAISAGAQHTCALRSDATVWCWGWDSDGQLGDGTTGDANHDRLLPVQVRKGSGTLTGVKAIGAGGLHTCALRPDSTVWCWGWDADGQLGDGTTGDAHNDRLLLAEGRLTAPETATAVARGGYERGRWTEDVAAVATPAPCRTFGHDRLAESRVEEARAHPRRWTLAVRRGAAAERSQRLPRGGPRSRVTRPRAPVPGTM